MARNLLKPRRKVADCRASCHFHRLITAPSLPYLWLTERAVLSCDPVTCHQLAKTGSSCPLGYSPPQWWLPIPLPSSGLPGQTGHEDCWLPLGTQHFIFFLLSFYFADFTDFAQICGFYETHKKHELSRSLDLWGRTTGPTAAAAGADQHSGSSMSKGCICTALTHPPSPTATSIRTQGTQKSAS